MDIIVVSGGFPSQTGVLNQDAVQTNSSGDVSPLDEGYVEYSVFASVVLPSTITNIPNLSKTSGWINGG